MRKTLKTLETLFFDPHIANFSWMVADAILINIAFALAYWIRYDLQLFRAVDPAHDVPLHVYLPFMALMTILLLVVYRQAGMYHLRRQISWFAEIYTIINGTATGTIITIVIIFLSQPTFYSRLIVIYAGVLAITLLSMSRLLKVGLLWHLRRKGSATARVLIIGAGEMGRTVMRMVVANPQLGFDVVGFLDDDPAKNSTDIGRFKALGSIDTLPQILAHNPPDEVLITIPWQYHRQIMRIIAQCDNHDVRIRVIPDVFQMTLSQMHIEEIGGIPMIGVKEAGISGLNQLMKRTLDLTITSTVLLGFAPIMAFIALLIKLESPGPVLFAQERVGKNGRRFTMYKFRSMVDNAESQRAALMDHNEADGPLFKMRDDPRITRVGKWLRRLSFDELPQLYNVLRGEMSLIGPRPPLPSEVEAYQEWHKRRLEVSPGLTGLWQVSGRSELTFDEMALLDIYYIENWSLGMDTRILWQTIPRVLLGTGAY